MSADDLDKPASGWVETRARERTPHALSEFDADLRRLRAAVLTMGSTVRQNVEDVMAGLVAGDVERCRSVIPEDETVDRMAKEVGEIGLRIIMRFRPVATDLRRVLSSMNMARILERIGDHAVNIARESRRILSAAAVAETKLLEPLFGVAMGILKDALTALADDNEELALALQRRDAELDRLHDSLGESVGRLIEERRRGAAILIHVVLVSRSLERIGDLAVNLGEEVVFILSAEDIRHVQVSEGRDPVREPVPFGQE